MSSPQHEPPAPRASNRPHRRWNRVIVPLVFVLIALFVLKDQVPAVDTWIQKQLRPGHWRAIEACRIVGIAAAQKPAYARLIESGEVHATRDGYYVENVVLGEMSEQGKERRYSFSCYVDDAGRVVKSHRTD